MEIHAIKSEIDEICVKIIGNTKSLPNMTPPMPLPLKNPNSGMWPMVSDESSNFLSRFNGSLADELTSLADLSHIKGELNSIGGESAENENTGSIW